MKNKIIILLSILILLVGCEEEQQVQSSFIGGTQGLVLQFEDFGVMENGIPSVFSTEEFPIVVNVKNKGEYDLAASDLSVSVKGISLQDFQGITSEIKNDRKIEGISQFNTNGGEMNMKLADRARYSIQVIGAYQPFDIYADAIYNYKTKISIPQVCFKGNPFDTSICNVKETKQVFTSGAPITITSVEEDSAGEGIIALKITAKNAGTGKVTTPEGTFDERFDRYDKFSFSTPSEFECISSGSYTEAKIVDGVAEIRCVAKKPLEKSEAYIRPISMEFSYKYKETISKPLRILSPQ